MVTEKKADFLGTPQFTGVTIPPPTATEGFKAEDIETLGTEEEGFEGIEGEGTGGESWEIPSESCWWSSSLVPSSCLPSKWAAASFRDHAKGAW
jgi:hypothetical protein